MTETDFDLPVFDDPRNSLRQTIRALINTKFRFQAREMYEEANEISAMVTACRQMLVRIDND